jgi:protein-tyrosine phosphatase
MNRLHHKYLVLPLACVSLMSVSPASARVTGADTSRAADGSLVLHWQSGGPVDVLVADKPGAAIRDAHLVSARDSDGSFIDADAGKATRHYFLLRDRSDGTVTRIAERVLPLQQGSNFRDIGGYTGAGGKTVRWGLIYRSGATPMLTADDLAQIRALGLHDMIDLRSNEERVLAPTRIDGVSYAAVGYSMQAMTPGGSSLRNGVALYHNFPKFFVPQLRIVFDRLKRNEGPLVYNCSAGQDRTGFTTAMVLSALGVSRDAIIRDYLLSTVYRRPRFEMPHIDLALYPDNAAAQMFARYQSAPGGDKPQPLIEADGTPFLAGAFAEIDGKWGSVDKYLKQEIGLSDQDLATIRHNALE